MGVTDNESIEPITRVEHNPDAAAKRVLLRAQDPSSGSWVNIAAVDNGDGTFSLSTTATLDGSDIEIGAVEIKNATTDDRAIVSAAGALSVDTELPAAGALADAATVAITTPTVGNYGFVRDRTNGNMNILTQSIDTLNSTGTGIQAIGNMAQYDDTSPTAITENRFGHLRISSNRNLYNTIRDAAGNERGANVNASGELNVAASIAASATATGTSVARFTALTNTAQAIKASAGNVYGYHLSNQANPAQDLYVHFYNVAAGSVTVGTTTPSRSFFLPGGAVIDTPYAYPMAFSTAISVAVSTTATGGTAPTNAIYVHAEYV